jgi:hypothetical protein
VAKSPFKPVGVPVTKQERALHALVKDISHEAPPMPMAPPEHTMPQVSKPTRKFRYIFDLEFCACGGDLIKMDDRHALCATCDNRYTMAALARRAEIRARRKRRR